MAAPTSSCFNWPVISGKIQAPFLALGAKIRSINLASATSVAKTAGIVVGFITLIGGFFCFLALPIMGAASIVAFTNPMFALPPVGFVVVVISLVVIFKFLPAKVPPPPAPSPPAPPPPP